MEELLKGKCTIQFNKLMDSVMNGDLDINVIYDHLKKVADLDKRVVCGTYIKNTGWMDSRATVIDRMDRNFRDNWPKFKELIETFNTQILHNMNDSNKTYHKVYAILASQNAIFRKAIHIIYDAIY